MRKRSRGGEKTFIPFSRWGWVFRGEQSTFIWRWRGRGAWVSFIYLIYFLLLLHFVNFLLFFLTFEGGRRHGFFPLFFCSFLKRERGHEFFSFCSPLELGKWVWVLLFHLLLLFLILEGGKGAMSYFLKENFTLERGRRVWVYLLTVYFVNFFYYLYSSVTFFNY